MDTALHEMAHALVFSGNLMKAFINPDTGLPWGNSVTTTQTIRELPTNI